jgi:hypothetical protein
MPTTVVARLPADFDTSPVNPGIAAVGSVAAKLNTPAVSYRRPVDAASVGRAIPFSPFTVVAPPLDVLVASPVRAVKLPPPLAAHWRTDPL